jgi:hypothetical protein
LAALLAISECRRLATSTVLKTSIQVLCLDRQHGVPLLLTTRSANAVPLTPFARVADGDTVSEADLQALIQAHPECLPISEIDAMFSAPVPICTELSTPAGPIDNFMVTSSGLPVLVECKLWRNPEARREVVGQILDYKGAQSMVFLRSATRGDTASEAGWKPPS